MNLSILFGSKLWREQKMNRLALLLVGGVLLLASCSETKSSQDVALEQLQHLYGLGYNVTELALRLECPEKDVVKFLQGEEKIDNSLCQPIDSLYKLNDDGDMIPVNKVGKSASECLWQIYTKAQNLPLTSQYTNVGVAEVGNALTKRKTLEFEDSIKVLVAYINNVNDLDTIPTHINVTPYYYNYNEGIGNIKVPRDYSLLYKNASDEQLLKLSYFIWQAEQFELEANANLTKSINERITKYVSNSVSDFVSKDVDSYWNMIRCKLKDDKEKKKFYSDKFKDRFNERQLQADVREEIASYCVSINCSRILAVNEVLGYDENVNNLGIAQKVVLKKAIFRMEGMQAALKQKNIEAVRDGLALSVPLALVVAQPQSVPLLSLASATNFVEGGLAYAGYEQMFGEIYKTVVGEELDSEKAMEKMQKTMQKELTGKLIKQVNRKNGYKQMLDQNTKLYYSNLRKDLGL